MSAINSHPQMSLQWKPDISIPPLVPPIKSWRPYRRKDHVAVTSLRRPSTDVLFGHFDMDEMLEISAHSLIMENTEGEVITCLCLRNYPNIPAVLPDVWPHVLSYLYLISDLNNRTTLFVHMLVCDDRYTWEPLTHLLKSLFMSLFQLQYIVLIVLPGCEKDAKLSKPFMDKYFIKMKPANKRHSNGQVMHVAPRTNILPNIAVRNAVAEDNDELVKILDQSTPALRRIYGEYYIAEIVLDQSSSRKILVAEIDNEHVGMMMINKNVWIERLASMFDLYTYHGFLKHNQQKTSNFTLESIEEDYDIFESTARHISDRFKSEWLEHRENTPPVVGLEVSNTVDSDSSTATEYYLMLWNEGRNGKKLSSTSQEDMLDVDESVHESQQKASSLSKGRPSKKSIERNREFDQQNVFVIELHGMRCDIDDRLCISLLKGTFLAYPGFNYCALSVPSTCRFFPLLSYFVKLEARKGVCNHEETVVYAVHINAIFSDIILRHASEADHDQIMRFHIGMECGEMYTNRMTKAIDEQENQAVHPYVILAEKTLIGVFILRLYDNLADLRHYYDVDAHILTKFHKNVCVMEMFILQPAFMVQLPFILSELFRLSGFTCIFYMQTYTPTTTNNSPNTMLFEMIPVRPRKPMHYELDKLHKWQWPSTPTSERNAIPYGLYFHSTKSCTKRKLHINERIVIVGCSVTALAFLDEMLFHKDNRNLFFTNVTLISPKGLMLRLYEDISDLAKSFKTSLVYTPAYVRRLALRTWINIINGYATRIDRKEKIVYVNDIPVAYDRLFMFCGLQFDFPIKLKMTDNEPRNVVFINNTVDAELMLIKARTISQLGNYRIVVYGDSVYCYTCINALISVKVNPAKITYIRPVFKPGISSTTTTFNDNFIDDVMQEMLKKSGIQVIDNYDIVDWRLTTDNTVSRIRVESELNALEIACSMFICYECKIVSRRTIFALNQAALVFDGRLVINENCQTNDPSIYAAGPMTKYKRALHADRMRHSFYDSHEIGAKLALKMVEELHPLQTHRLPEHKIFPHALPVVNHYKNCIVSNHPVLGGLHYLSIRAPGPPMQHDLDKDSPKYGVDLITGVHNYRSNINYCRVHLNLHNRVHDIVCLTKKNLFRLHAQNQPLNVQKYVALWGQHEMALGQLRLNFESKNITDLHAHFTKPWVYLLYHDRFDSHLDAHNNLAIHCAEKELINEMHNEFVNNKWKHLTEKQRSIIVRKYLSASHEQRIIKNLANFIMEHSNELTMLADLQTVEELI